MSFLTKITKNYQIMSSEEAQYNIIKKSKEFLEITERYLNLVKANKVNFIGLGNSLSAGWSAVNQDVRPFILKLKKILAEEINNSGIDINFYNYAIAANNSNWQILDFIKQNPTETDVKKHFIADVKQWKEEFDNTLFENYIDLNEAVKLYPDSNTEFLSNYKNDSLTINLLNGCTGAFLNNVTDQFSFENIIKGFKEDKDNLVLLIEYLKNLKEDDKNMIFIGNFPHISTPVGLIANRYLDKIINNDIKTICAENNVNFFAKNQIALLQPFINPVTKKKVIKVDNHPRMDEQYTVLFHYFCDVITTLKNKSRTLTK